MTEKRYRVHEFVRFSYSEIGEYIDEHHTDKPLRNDEVVDLLNEQHEQIERLKRNFKELDEENEQLKLIIKDVVELLSEEVDVFSDRATEHDINAYMELKELDNKDAYYIAISTKKAIQMLKEIKE